METHNVETAVAGSVTSQGFAVDLHVKTLDEGVVKRAKSNGLDALVYAPHFTRLPEIKAQAERFSDSELAVYPGRELFTGTWQRRQHVLALGLDEKVPDFLTLDGTMAELRRQDAAVLVPHPEFLNVSLSRNEIRAYRDTIDAIEVYNPKYLPHHHSTVPDLAEEFGLPTFASSYAHLPWTVGEAFVDFDKHLTNESELVEALHSGDQREIVRNEQPTSLLYRGLEFVHLGYENSWKKFDRVMLQGTAPTHPDHVAYGGQFDDVKVY
jgi:predicted metal-dependent phosphoesterase TrpH